MAYQATVIPVMIASPGDVPDERDVVRSVIHDWNDVNAAASGVMLAPVGWDTHASPELGTRPQELINTRVLRECDLLVGVFWTRVGTPTGKAQSGTVEEIEEHVDAGKPAMLYFSSRPAAPESVEPDQLREVKAFRVKCEERGLVESFDSTDDFRAKFAKQLQFCLAKNEFLQGLTRPEGGKPRVEELLSSEPASYSLSGEAITLLKAAASGKSGTITKRSFLGGRVIQAGGQAFGKEPGRESAKWEGALDELLEEGLVVARGYKDQIFELTHQGWALADTL